MAGGVYSRGVTFVGDSEIKEQLGDKTVSEC